MKRLFIGIPVGSESAARHVRSWQSDRLLNENRFGWSRPENWHITLYFLGDTEPSRVPLLNQIVDESFEGVTAFQTELTGAGVFPNFRNPKVFWLGLKSLEPVMAAYEQLGKELQENGFAFDPKPLKPHLTIARIKSIENRVVFNSLLNKFGGQSFGEVEINRVVVFESTLSPSGPVYKPLHQKLFK
jgi:2'-5' RNA ligase